MMMMNACKICSSEALSLITEKMPVLKQSSANACFTLAGRQTGKRARGWSISRRRDLGSHG